MSHSREAELPEAVDLSHHINRRSKARHPSPLKDIIKYMSYDGMISLAGGKNIPTCSLWYYRRLDALTSAHRIATSISVSPSFR